MAAATAARRPASSLNFSSQMTSPQLFLATIAISSLWTVPTAETFSIKTQPWQRPRQRQRQQQGIPGSCLLHNRGIHLPPRRSSVATSSLSADANESDARRSVTGPVYECEAGVPAIKLFTKRGCTLCDKVKDVLESVRENQPHSLYAVDITDDDKQNWFSKYM